jgi:hypothetical protein
MKNSSLSVSLLVAALAAPASGQCLLDRFSTPPGAGVQQSFGASVALDGDRLAVGAAAPSGFGQVHLYREQPSGEWLFEATVVPPSPTLYFGNALALRGDRLAVHDRTAGLVRFYDLSGPVPALETKQISIGAGEFVRLALSDTHLALLGADGHLHRRAVPAVPRGSGRFRAATGVLRADRRSAG